jgi:hypothetical protein
MATLEPIYLRQIVEAGGGTWVGLQDTFIADRESLVLFNAPTSKTTLALGITVCTVDNVRGKIADAEASFQNKPIAIPRKILQNFAERLNVLAAEISEFTERK